MIMSEDTSPQLILMDVNAKQMEFFNQLMMRVGCKTHQELIFCALDVLEWVTDEVDEGNQIQSVDNLNQENKVLKKPFMTYIEDQRTK
jgi:hypothetical protein